MKEKFTHFKNKNFKNKNYFENFSHTAKLYIKSITRMQINYSFKNILS